jgi:hypothetical protein
MRHSYISPGIIDASVVHKQAHERMVDTRSPGDTLVHDHAYGVSCDGLRHWQYTVGSKNSSQFNGTAEMTTDQVDAQLMTQD